MINGYEHWLSLLDLIVSSSYWLWLLVLIMGYDYWLKSIGFGSLQVPLMQKASSLPGWAVCVNCDTTFKAGPEGAILAEQAGQSPAVPCEPTSVEINHPHRSSSPPSPYSPTIKVPPLRPRTPGSRPQHRRAPGSPQALPKDQQPTVAPPHKAGSAEGAGSEEKGGDGVGGSAPAEAAGSEETESHGVRVSGSEEVWSWDGSVRSVAEGSAKASPGGFAVKEVDGLGIQRLQDKLLQGWSLLAEHCPL